MLQVLFLDGLNESWSLRTRHQIVYSKGVHLVVDQLTPNERVLAFWDDSQRLFYVIPMGNRSVIGTTDTRVEDPHTSVTDEDKDFLLSQINDRLDLMTPLSNKDIIAERSGVRPLLFDDSQETLKTWIGLLCRASMRLRLIMQNKLCPYFGGKLTDCLNVGEEVASAVQTLGIHLLPDQRRWYGEPGRESRRAFSDKLVECVSII